jgi:photosynthetic reaction center cytochrome c subunit
MRLQNFILIAAAAVFSAGPAVAAPAKTPPPPPPPPPAAASPAPVAPADPSKAEGHYKNIQVLNGTPWEDVVPAMQFITASLGVDCDFCHVDHAPEKDDKKEKETARKMITMMRAINHDNFSGREVTCVTCHHGAEHPASIPEVAKSTDAPAPHEHEHGAQPAERPAAAAVLAKYLEAVGGRDAIAKVEGHVQKGSLAGFGPDPVPVEVKAKAGGKRIAVVHNPRGDNTTAVNGDKGGWLGNSGRPPREMSATESAAARLDAALLYPADIAPLFAEFTTAPSEPIDGKETVLVVARNPGKPPTRIWFDAQSGLAVRLLRLAETPLGQNPTQVDFGDYRDAGGVKIPFRWTVSRPSGQFTIQLSESRQDVPVPDSTFDKPAAEPPPPPPPPPS